jgi:hypothetical protein
VRLERIDAFDLYPDLAAIDRLDRDVGLAEGDEQIAGAGRELERDAQQLRVRLFVGATDMGPEPGAGRRAIGSDLGEPNHGLDRLNLAEERAQILESVMPPVLQQPRRLRRHLPLIRVRQAAPVVDIAADLVDEPRNVVLLLGRRESVVDAEAQFCLSRRATPPLWQRDRRDQVTTPSRFNDAIGRLAVGIEVPMPGGIGIR